MFGLMQMVDRLKAWDIEATYHLDTDSIFSRYYTFIAKKDGRTITRQVSSWYYGSAHPDSYFDNERKSVVRDIIEEFYKDEFLSTSKMSNILVKHGMSVNVETITNSVGRLEDHFTVFRNGRALKRIYAHHYGHFALSEIEKMRLYFLMEIIEAFDIEEQREKEPKLNTLDLNADVRTMYPSTLHMQDIISRIIKEQESKKVWVTTAGCGPETQFEKLIKERIKEKEMSNNNISWSVKGLTLTRSGCPYEKDHFDVELEGTIVGPISGDLSSISNDIQKKLNVPDNNYALRKAAYQLMMNSLYGVPKPSTKLPKIQKVIFNNPATIVIWADETKTIVKAQNNEIFDPEKGLAMAITKKALGNEGNYFDTIKKYVTEYQDSIENEKPHIDISMQITGGFARATASVKKLAKRMEEQAEHSKKWTAYQRLQNALHDKKATKADLLIAMEEAIGYLGEELE